MLKVFFLKNERGEVLVKRNIKLIRAFSLISNKFQLEYSGLLGSHFQYF